MACKYVRDASAEDESADAVRRREDASRRYIRSLHQHPVLSAPWLELVQSLEQLARMTQLEMAMPAKNTPVEAQGRDNDSAGTLWDQERHESAIRILVEEAKVNLSIRMMEDYKRWHYSSLVEDRERQLDRRCQQFEEALGFLLWRTLLHLETLQLTDVRLLLELCTLALSKCQQLGMDAPGNVKGQETMVLYYWGSVMRHAESLNNAEVLAKMQECQLVPLIVEHMNTHVARYPFEVISAIAAAFASLAENEDFATSWERFFESREAKVAFLELEAKVVQPVLQADPSSKRALRPLLDFFKTMQRAM